MICNSALGDSSGEQHHGTAVADLLLVVGTDPWLLGKEVPMGRENRMKAKVGERKSCNCIGNLKIH